MNIVPLKKIKDDAFVELKKLCYLYMHLKPSGEVFYIGIGSTKDFKRAYSKRNRNRHWKYTVDKYNYEVVILAKGLDRDLACELEEILIEWYGRKDLCTGTLVNMTSGGEGIKQLSKESIEKIRQANLGSKGMKGKDNPMFGLLGDKNPNYGSKRTVEQKKNISKSLKGKAKGDKNPMWGIRGKDNPNYGRKMSESNKEKLRNLFKGRRVKESTKQKLKGPRKKIQGGNHPKSCTILCQETGIFYFCIKDAAYAVGMNYSTLVGMLSPNCKNPNKSSFKKL